jgi:hypothetical protein
MKQVRPQITMCDFIYGGCTAVKESDSFLTFWLATKRNPCLVCGPSKLNCFFHHKLIEQGIITDDPIFL